MPGDNTSLDVWIVESNVVYRGVPFTVVADWIQQGRLLDEDCVRTPEATEWTRLAKHSALAAYLPRPEPFRAEDRAEALEPVELGLSWKKRSYDADEDVDMIPLIDVSLVLLIFFMMTATVGGAAGLIPTPKARHGSNLANTTIWIGIDCERDKEGQLERNAAGQYEPRYSLGQGNKRAEPGARNEPSRTQILEQLNKLVAAGDSVEIRIKAHPLLPYEVVRDLTVALEPYKLNNQVRKVYAEVSERDNR